jgi:hypothetical protein
MTRMLGVSLFCSMNTNPEFSSSHAGESALMGLRRSSLRPFWWRGAVCTTYPIRLCHGSIAWRPWRSRIFSVVKSGRCKYSEQYVNLSHTKEAPNRPVTMMIWRYPRSSRVPLNLSGLQIKKSYDSQRGMD